MTSYDRWLEAPYQEAAAAADAETAIAEDASIEAECSDCADPLAYSLDELDAEVSEVSSWRQGRFGGYSARVSWRCPDCGEPQTRTIDDDNIDL